MLVSKIVSGGQTGVDRGAIAAAFDLGFPYGGLIPKGRFAEDGIVPEYHTIDDARSNLGNLAVIRDGFATLQKKVYAA